MDADRPGGQPNPTEEPNPPVEHESVLEPARPRPDPSPAKRSRKLVFGLTALVVLVVGALALLLVRANLDNTDLRDELALTEAEVDGLAADLDAAETERVDLQGQLDELNAEMTKTETDLEATTGQLEEVRAGVIEFFALAMGVGGGLDETDAECMSEVLADELGVGELLTGVLQAANAGMVGAEPGTETMRFGLAVADAALECDVDLGFAGVGDGGFTYGDNPFFDGLWDQCAEGVLVSCDTLYLQSPIGSEYERYGKTCGDRFTLEEAPFACASSDAGADTQLGVVAVDGAPLSPFPIGLAAFGDDPALGEAIPTLTGVDLNGEPLTIGADGTPKAIAFLAHWCVHCRAEVPQVTEWFEETGGIEGVDITAVATSINPIRDNYPPDAWLESEGWPADTMRDDADNSAHLAFGGGSFPYWVFVDADGRVVARTEGRLDIDTFETFLLLARDG